MINLFIEKRGGLLSNKMRKEVLWAACRWNHPDVAALVLESGDVDVFTSQSFATGLQGRTCALWVAAEYNSIACVELVFKSCQPSDVQELKAKTAIKAAFQIAATAQHLEILKLILPYETRLSLSEQFLLAATVDSGIATMEAFHGPDCLQSNGNVLATDTAWRGTIPSIGSEALRLATEWLCPSNVDLLLKRGVRPTSKLFAGLAKTDQEVIALQAIGEMLERRGYELSSSTSIESSGIGEGQCRP